MDQSLPAVVRRSRAGSWLRATAIGVGALVVGGLAFSVLTIGWPRHRTLGCLAVDVAASLAVFVAAHVFPRGGGCSYLERGAAVMCELIEQDERGGWPAFPEG